jgi:hypothetical protein
MALEAGSAAHQVFAAVRLWQLGHEDGLPEHFHYHGKRLFKDRFEQMLASADPREDERTQRLNFCLTALETSGFHDDPSDKRRTMNNLEEAMIAYIDRWPFGKWPIWVEDPDDPTSSVGIEVPLDMVITFTMSDGTVEEYRFTGKMDGLHWDSVERKKLVNHENKTASRLDEAWRNSFEMSSQVTGYCLAASAWVGTAVTDALIHGVSIPLPKSYDYGGIVKEPVSRQNFHFEHWFNWFYHSVSMYNAHKNNPIPAPRYTHSCNRYFRSCSLLSFCASPDDEKEQILKEMRHEEWSPLHEDA